MPGSREREQGAAAFGREALSQWGSAVRYGSRAIAAEVRERLRERAGSFDLASLRERLEPSETEQGGRADAAAAVPEPIQESIDVALPVGGAFALASRFLDFPEYLDRVIEAEQLDETRFVFVVRAGRRLRELDVEIVEEIADRRIEWECAGELSHSGVFTFHPLAPSLTRLELTIDRQPEGLSERLWRWTQLTGWVIQGELRRFKAHVELLDADFEDYVPEADVHPEDEGPEGGEKPEREPPDEEAEAPEEEQVEELEPA